MTTQHTPGPWTYNLTTGVVRSLAKDFPNCRQPVICDLRHWPHEDTTYIHPANATLIAAAPDLLEALTCIAEKSTDARAIGCALEAITKATGEAVIRTCNRCGKVVGTNDWDIHTCTPKQESESNKAAYQRGYLDGIAKPCIECADRKLKEKNNG